MSYYLVFMLYTEGTTKSLNLWSPNILEGKILTYFIGSQTAICHSEIITISCFGRFLTLGIIVEISTFSYSRGE